MYPSESRHTGRGNWTPGEPSQAHIISYFSRDGLAFTREPGICIAQEFALEAYGLYAAEVVALPGNSGWRMYCA